MLSLSPLLLLLALQPFLLLLASADPLCSASLSGSSARHLGLRGPGNPPPLPSPVTSPARPFGLPLAGNVQQASTDYASFVFANASMPLVANLNIFRPGQNLAVEGGESYTVDARLITLTQPISNLRIYFLNEAATYHSSFGYSLSNGIIDASANLVFPDASKPMDNQRKLFYPLLPGDFVDLGAFSNGTTLYPFLVVNGAKGHADTVLWADESKNPDQQVHVSAFAIANTGFVLLTFEDKDALVGDYNDLVVALDIGLDNVDALIRYSHPAYISRRPNCATPQPTIYGPLLVGETTIRGSSASTDSSIVKIFVNGNPAASVSLSSSAEDWSINLAKPLAQNDEVVAVIALVDGQESMPSPAILVTRPTTIPVIRTPVLAGSSKISGTDGNEPVGTVIRLFADDELVGQAVVQGLGAGGESWWSLTLSFPLSQGTLLTAIAQDVNGGKAASKPSIPVQVQVRTSSPIISTPVLANSGAISGAVKAPPASIVHIFLNDEPLGNAIVGPNYVFALKGVGTLTPGSIITATAVAPDCLASVTSDAVMVQLKSSPPTILQPLRAGATQISGSSSEAPGSAVSVYVDGHLVRGTAIVGDNGIWVLHDVAALREGCIVTATVVNSMDNRIISEISEQAVVLPEFDPETSPVPSSTNPASDAMMSVTITRVDRGTGTVSGTTRGVSAGTLIVLLSDGVALGSASVDQRGGWSIQVPRIALNSGVILTAWISMGDISSAHGTYTISTDEDDDNSNNSNKPFVTVNPILYAGASFVKGSALPAGGIVKVFVGAVPIASTQVTADRTWSVSGIGPSLLVKGSRVSAIIIDDSGRTLAVSNEVVVMGQGEKLSANVATSNSSAIVASTTASLSSSSMSYEMSMSINVPHTGDRVITGSCDLSHAPEAASIRIQLNGHDIGKAQFPWDAYAPTNVQDGDNEAQLQLQQYLLSRMGSWSLNLPASYPALGTGDRVSATIVVDFGEVHDVVIGTCPPVITLPLGRLESQEFTTAPTINLLPIHSYSPTISGSCSGGCQGFAVVLYAAGIPIASTVVNEDGSFEFSGLSTSLLSEDIPIGVVLTYYSAKDPRIAVGGSSVVPYHGDDNNPYDDNNDKADDPVVLDIGTQELSGSPPIAPYIYTPILASSQAISGTCHASVGSVISILRGSNPSNRTVIATTTIQFTGIWSISLSDFGITLQSLDVITARVTNAASGLYSDSVISVVVTPTSAAPLTAPVIKRPVMSGTSHVKGTSVHPLTTVTVYVDGRAFGSTTSARDGTWEVIGAAPIEGGSMVTAVTSDPALARGTSPPCVNVMASSVQMQSTVVIDGIATTVIVTTSLGDNGDASSIGYNDDRHDDPTSAMAPTIGGESILAPSSIQSSLEDPHIGVFGLPRSFVAGSSAQAVIALVDPSVGSSQPPPNAQLFAASMVDVSRPCRSPSAVQQQQGHRVLTVSQSGDNTVGFSLLTTKSGEYRIYVTQGTAASLDPDNDGDEDGATAILTSSFDFNMPVSGSPFELTVVAGQSSAAATTVSGPGVNLCALNTDCPLRVVVRDAFGNVVGRGGDQISISVDYGASHPDVADHQDGTYTAVVRLTKVGDHMVAISLGGTAIQGSPFSVVATATPGVPSAAHSALEPSLGQRSFCARAGEPFTAVLRGRSNVGVELSLGCCAADLVRATVASYPLVVTRSDDGTWLITGDAPTRVGSHTILALMGSTPVQPVILVVNPGFASPSQTKVSVEPERPAAGMEARVLVSLVDEFGNEPASYRETDVVSISLQGPGFVKTNNPKGTAARVSDSMFVVAFSAQVVGTYAMIVSLNDNLAGGGVFTIPIIPGSLSPVTSAFSLDDDNDSDGVASSISAGIESIFDLDARDALGNSILFDPATTDVAISSSPSINSSVSWFVKEGSSIQVRFTASYPGTYRITLSAAGGSIIKTVSVGAPSPLILVSAILSDSGTEIFLKFSGPTDRAGNVGGFFSCDMVLDDASVALLSHDALCSWIDDAHLRALIGSTPTVVVSSKLQLRAGHVHSKFVAPTNASAAAGFAFVQAPLNPRCVIPILVAPSRVGSCDALVLDASRTLGLAGRSGRFAYSLVLAGTSTTPSASLVSTLNAVTGPLLTVGASDMTLGARYTFRVTVTNWLGGTGTADLVVDKVRGSAPVVAMETVKHLKAGPNGRCQGSRLAAVITPSACGCAPPYTLKWTQPSGPAVHLVADTNSELMLPPLIPGEYVFAMSASCVSDPAQTSFAATRLIVTPNPLSAAIIGGSSRTSAISAPLTLEARSAITFLGFGDETVRDNHDAEESLECSWVCTGSCFQAPYTAALLVGAPCKFTLPSNSLAAGISVFAVRIRDIHSGLFSSTKQVVHAASSCASTVSASLMAANSRRVALSGCASTESCASLHQSCPTPSFRWSVVSGDIDISDSSLRTTDINGPYLVLKTRSLTPGQSYTLRMDASCVSTGIAGYAEVSVNIPIPPNGGRLTVTPTIGIAGETEFLMRTTNWVDSDSPTSTTPVRFEYWIKPLDSVTFSNSSVYNRTWIFASSASPRYTSIYPEVPVSVSSSGTARLFLPISAAGLSSADVVVVVYAIDYSGFRTAAFATIHLNSGVNANADAAAIEQRYNQLLSHAPSSSATLSAILTTATVLPKADVSAAAMTLRTRLIGDVAAFLPSLETKDNTKAIPDPLDLEMVLWIAAAITAAPLSSSGFDAALTLLEASTAVACALNHPVDGINQAFGSAISGLSLNEGSLGSSGHDARLDRLRGAIGDMSLCILAETVPGENPIELSFSGYNLVLRRFASSKDISEAALSNHQYITLQGAQVPNGTAMNDGSCVPFEPVDVQSIVWKSASSLREHKAGDGGRKKRKMPILEESSISVLRSNTKRMKQTEQPAGAAVVDAEFTTVEQLLAHDEESEIHKVIPRGTRDEEAIEVCGYWDRRSKSWSRSGCIVTHSEDGAPIRCDCYRSKKGEYSLLRGESADNANNNGEQKESSSASSSLWSKVRSFSTVSRYIGGEAFALTQDFILPKFVALFFGVLIAVAMVSLVVAGIADARDSHKVIRRSPSKHDNLSEEELHSRRLVVSHTVLGIFWVSSQDSYTRVSRVLVLFSSIAAAFASCVLAFRMFPHMWFLYVGVLVSVALLPVSMLLSSAFKGIEHKNRQRTSNSGTNDATPTATATVTASNMPIMDIVSSSSAFSSKLKPASFTVRSRNADDLMSSLQSNMNNSNRPTWFFFLSFGLVLAVTIAAFLVAVIMGRGFSRHMEYDCLFAVMTCLLCDWVIMQPIQHLIMKTLF